MDKSYWEKYYEKFGEPFHPSEFAKFAMGYLSEGDIVLELGSGNGRDAVFFGSNGIKTIGLEQCQNIVDELNAKDFDNVEFKARDFSLPQMEFKHNHVYSRFTLHSVPDDVATRTLECTREALNGYFFIEVRSDKDALVGKKTDHYRRFVNFEDLLSELIVIGFRIHYAELSRGFSEYNSKFGVDNNEKDPMLIRIVAS